MGARHGFSDISVSIPKRDVNSKVSHKAADGCHLGRDLARRGHLVYVPQLGRISTFRVISWCSENKFNIAQTITTKTPVEYHQVDDLKTDPVTRKLLPGAFRRPRAVASAALKPPP